VIEVCNQPATVISASFTQILFYMPSCTLAGNKTIFVTIGGVNVSSIVYSYLPPAGPIISSISPISSNPTIKTTITIQGSGFGSNQSAVEVFLANATGKIYQLKIITFSNATIVAGLSGGEPGVFTVQVTIDGMGDSRPGSSGADQFAYSVSITSVSPSTGSYFGGTLLTIKGINFSPAYSDTLVYIGDTPNWFCTIESITTTQISCRTPPISKYYDINETVAIVISTKLYMLSTCPSNNCIFRYAGKDVSPSLITISPTSATT
jgi:hypothetical protein